MAYTASTNGTTVQGVTSVEVKFPTTVEKMTTGIQPAVIDWSKLAEKSFNGKTFVAVNPSAPLDVSDQVTVEVKPINNIYRNSAVISNASKVPDVRGESIYVKYDTSLIKDSVDAAGNTVRQLLPIKASISLSIPSDIDVKSDVVIEMLSRTLSLFYATGDVDASTATSRLDQYRRNAITRS